MLRQGISVTGTSSAISREQERELISRVRVGDRNAYRELVDQHGDRLHAFIWRMVRNHHDAEDICQDAFLKAFASIDSFKSQYRFSTWLFTIGYRVCLNQIRRKRAVSTDIDFNALPDANPSDNAIVAESEDAARVRSKIWEAVDRLTPPQRATVLLFYRQEFGCQEIARILQLPPATVKSHLHRARGRLRDLLDPMTERDWTCFRNLSERAG